MTLTGYAYEIMELLQKNLVDDFFIDIRLVKQMIKDQRQLAISNAINKGGQSGGGQDYGTSSGYDGGWEAYVVTTVVDMEIVNPIIDPDPSCIPPCIEYPLLWKSTDEFPDVLTMGRRPAVLRIIPLYGSDIPIKSNILFSSHDRARFVGNGRFNTHQVVGYIRDDTLWLTSKNPLCTDNFQIIVDAIFADPTELPDFNEEIDEFPLGKLWPYMIPQILEALLLKFKLQEDKINDATNP